MGKKKTRAAKKLSHLDEGGRARMVDVSGKAPTRRMACAEGYVVMSPAALACLRAGSGPKGDVLAVARIAGIQAAKRCGELIPLCHPLPIEQATVEFFPQAPDRVRIEATATITAKTGVEMEALTAVAVAALTVVDMLKAVDLALRIEGVRVLWKRGGKSDYRAK